MCKVSSSKTCLKERFLASDSLRATQGRSASRELAQAGNPAISDGHHTLTPPELLATQSDFDMLYGSLKPLTGSIYSFLPPGFLGSPQLGAPVS